MYSSRCLTERYFQSMSPMPCKFPCLEGQPDEYRREICPVCCQLMYPCLMVLCLQYRVGSARLREVAKNSILLIINIEATMILSRDYIGS
jgi:hypothetical protein